MNEKIRVPYALNVYGEEEKRAVNEVLSSNNLAAGKKVLEFEAGIANIFGKKHGIMVNSGSSANLLAVELLKLPEKSGVITPILTFSTTLSPLIMKGYEPIFVDVEEGTYIANMDEVRDNSANANALMLPHLLGNVLDMESLHKISTDRNIPFIEDSCDTLGATFNGKPAGAYSDISTTSFYGSHVITAAGGGGMVCVNNKDYDRRARILRGWGRSSAVNESEDIDLRFNIKVDGIPYDSKFVFEELGYNFLPLEISAAFGLEQLKKLKDFTEKRQKNFSTLLEFFKKYDDLFILPKQNPLAKTNWISFPLTIKPGAKFTRHEISKYLESNNIQTRPIFTGNALRQPAFKNVKSIRKDFPITDDIMKNGFVIGAHQGLTKVHMNYMMSVLSKFLDRQ